MKLFTIFGDPVSHSISPLLHNIAIKNLNLNACYTRYHLLNGQKIIESFKNLNLSGANVTVPHKEIAYKGCDEIRGVAKSIKAVNTLVREKDKIIGYNTDAPGFYESIKSFKKIKNSLILGAGGTAKAIAFILREHSIEATILNRSQNRLDFFKNNGFNSFDWNNFKIENYDLIINTTPAGLKDSNLPFNETALNTLMKNSNYAFDAVYGKITPFLKLAQENSLIFKDGSDMLLYQAVLAFNLFYKNRFKPEIIEKEMKKIFTL